MNNEWENSWKAKKITKETINEMNILLSTKKLLIERMFDREDSRYELCCFLEACKDFIGYEISYELFHYFVNNGTIELKYLNKQ
jgi:hypothetical protein